MNTEASYYFSAPGRTEISGNHTDHQRGCVLAGAVDLEATARVQFNGTDEICIFSQGYAPFSVSIHELEVQPGEVNASAALVRGVAKGFVQRGAVLRGFDAYIQSTVMPGSGLSSSAAFEVLLGTILNHLFLEARLTPVEVAKIGQYAENVYMGKPCGLLDQMACALGNAVYMDFADPEKPHVEPVEFDPARYGFGLCIIDSGADHAGLTEEYAAIPREMQAVAVFFGKEVLRQVQEEAFYAQLPQLREAVGDRAVLRAMHFFEENRRVQQQVRCLREGDMDRFLELVRQSGESSWCLLQNIAPAGAVNHQQVAMALALAKQFLEGQGAVRVHGGGFAGTIQAFVPCGLMEVFCAKMEAVLGAGCCRVLSIRPQGGIRVK